MTATSGPVARVLEALESRGCGPKRNGRGYKARCPAHEDRSPSLSVDVGEDGRALICCHGGCPADRIVEALGLTRRDLMPDSPRSNGRAARQRDDAPPTFATCAAAIAHLERKDGKCSATWQYHNADGEHIGAVLRWSDADGKRILPVSLIGGRWSNRAMPTPRPLYGLAALLASEPSATIVVVEGEKCADAARSLGLLATTSAGGSNAARMTDWAPLAGREVALIPDNDDAGERYMRDISAALLALAPPARVRVVRLPELANGGDIVDWLDHQDSTEPDALRAMVENLIEGAPCATPAPPVSAASVGGPVLVRLADVQPEHVRWLWPGRIAVGKLTLLAGDPGLGKSFVTLDMAARLSSGRPWPDQQGDPNPPGGVVLLSAEDDPGDTIRPRLDAAGADVGRIALLKAVREPTGDGGAREALFSLSADLPALEDAIRSVEGCRLVVIDPVSAYLGDTDSHENAAVRGLLAPLADLAARRAVAIVAVTHLRKGEGPAIYRAMGSLAFVAASRAAWAVSRDPEDESGRRRLFLPLKNNLAPTDQTGLAFELGGIGGTAVVAWDSTLVTKTADEALGIPLRRRGPEPAVTAQAARWVAEELADGQEHPVAELKAAAADAGLGWRTVQKASAELGVVALRRSFGGGGVWRLPIHAQNALDIRKPCANGETLRE